LHLETRNTHMHIGGIAIFEPGPWKSHEERYQALVHHIEPRLDLMPRYRQKVAFLPMNVDLPVWQDDEKFDISFHVKRAALPSPGGRKELNDYVERVFSRQLDRRRPLWELYYIEGLEGGRWALLSKTHHSLVDGLSALELATVLMDISPDYRPPVEGSRWRPEKETGTLGLVFKALQMRASSPPGIVKNAVEAASNPGRLAAALAEAAGALAVVSKELTTPEGPLNGPTGPTRTYWYSRFALSEFKEIKQAFGGTINDVVVGVVSGGLRKYLEMHDEDVDHLSIQALMPVSLRDDKQKTALGNVLSMMIVKLPVDEPFPAARMRKAKANIDRLKKSKQALGADILLKLAGFAPATLHAMVARVSLRTMNYNTIVTNVPGPQWPLYTLGCQLETAMPIAFLYEGQQLATAIFSYLGTINFGYIADRHAFPDLPRLGECMEESFAELLDVARAGQAGQDAAAAQRRPARRRPAAKSARTRRSAASSTGTNGSSRSAASTGRAAGKAGTSRSITKSTEKASARTSASAANPRNAAAKPAPSKKAAAAQKPASAPRANKSTSTAKAVSARKPTSSIKAAASDAAAGRQVRRRKAS
jgi:WS/DGAT/MGAT family acyltransferase